MSAGRQNSGGGTPAAPRAYASVCGPIRVRLLDLKGSFSMSVVFRVSPRQSLVPLRLVLGIGFLAHGMAKLQRGPAKFATLLHQLHVPLPVQMAWLTTATEILGGVALIVGLFVALATLPLIATMLVAMFTIHIHNGFSAVNTVGLTPAGPVFGQPGFEINLLYIAGLAALALAGPTPLSLDALRGRATPPAT
jgi:putative oxidoreductase